MAGSAPKTIQSSTGRFGNGATTINTNTKSFENFSYFLGGIDVTHQNLDQFTPYIKGVSRIFMHKPPLFMLAKYPEHTKRFTHRPRYGVRPRRCIPRDRNPSDRQPPAGAPGYEAYPGRGYVHGLARSGHFGCLRHGAGRQDHEV